MTAMGVAGACAWALCMLGMGLLSQAMDRHGTQIGPWGEPGPVRKDLLRSGGALALVLALWHCVNGWGAAVGVVAWLGGLSVAALLVAGLLTYAARSAAAVVLLAGGAALVWSGMHGMAA